MATAELGTGPAVAVLSLVTWPGGYKTLSPPWGTGACGQPGQTIGPKPASAQIRVPIQAPPISNLVVCPGGHPGKQPDPNWLLLGSMQVPMQTVVT